MSAKQQRRIIRRLIDSEPPEEVGQKKYVISARWYQKWHDFVNYKPQEGEFSSDGSITEGFFYGKPSQISNTHLLNKDTNQLLPGLVEHFDYKVIPASVWYHL